VTGPSRTPKAYNDIVKTILDPEDLELFEWAMGCVLSNGPRVVVLIGGEPGSGQSVLLSIARQVLFNAPQHDRTLRVAVQRHGYGEADDETNVFAAENLPVAISGAIRIRTSGRRVPAHKCFVFLTQLIQSELYDIAELCVGTYNSIELELD